MTAALFTHIGREITAATGRPFAHARGNEAGGGCINRAFLLEGGGERYFVKLNEGRSRHTVSAIAPGVALPPASMRSSRGTRTPLYVADALKMFEAEAEGLKEMAATKTVRVPMPLCSGVAEGQAFLVLEYLSLHASDAHAQETLGRQLARMHRVTAPTFGWRRNNTIGSTPQPNTPMANWVTFWRDQRLGFQLQLAANNNGRTLRGKGEQLLEQLPAFFADYRPVASLLHGDLWGGNAAVTADREPVIFDPAVYYGDRETDIAMTELFGGFSARFHAAYREAWPLDAGYRVRKNLYNLYHVLNHFNLFGGGYRTQAEHLVDALLSEVR